VKSGERQTIDRGVQAGGEKCKEYDQVRKEETQEKTFQHKLWKLETILCVYEAVDQE
jgi:hypothetical protein